MWMPPERVSGVGQTPYLHRRGKHPHYKGVLSLIALCKGLSIGRLRNPPTNSEYHIKFNMSQSPNKAGDFGAKINKRK